MEEKKKFPREQEQSQREKPPVQQTPLGNSVTESRIVQNEDKTKRKK